MWVPKYMQKKWGGNFQYSFASRQSLLIVVSNPWCMLLKFVPQKFLWNKFRCAFLAYHKQNEIIHIQFKSFWEIISTLLFPRSCIFGYVYPESSSLMIQSFITIFAKPLLFYKARNSPWQLFCQVWASVCLVKMIC